MAGAYTRRICHGTSKIKSRHHSHLGDPQPPIVDIPAMDQDSMYDEYHGGEAKRSAHGGAAKANSWIPKFGMESCNDTKGGEDRDVGPNTPSATSRRIKSHNTCLG